MISIKIELHDQEDAENLSLIVAQFMQDFDSFVTAIQDETLSIDADSVTS